jgi:hypothetical protein
LLTLIAGVLLLAGCGTSATPSVVSGSPTVSASAAESQTATSQGMTPSPSATATPDSTEPEVDAMAEVLANGLSLRSHPSTDAELLGVLQAGYLAFVVDGPVEADGHRWYLLASSGQPSTTECDSAEPPSLEGCSYFGWAAGTSVDSDRWLERRDVDCPSERTVDTYLAMAPEVRLACAGHQKWKLRAYIAPLEGGRGCYPGWVTNPGWLDAQCGFFYPQPTNDEFDDDSRLQSFISPDFHASFSCPPDDGLLTCIRDELKGSWIVMTGHLDDPAARRCKPELTGLVPQDLPDRTWVAFQCRLRFVVTNIRVEG